jgi:hypothetical protein
MEVTIDGQQPMLLELHEGVRTFADARAALFRPTLGAAGS